MIISSPIAILKESVQIFFDKRNMKNLVKIYLPLIPFAIFSIIQSSYFRDRSQIEDPRLATTVVLVNIAYLIVYLWIYISGVMGVKQVISDKPLVIRDIYKKSWKMVWKFSLLSVVLLLIYLGGLILLIIPALIFGIWYGFAKFTFIDKGMGIRESLVFSKNLVKGKFWAVLGRFIVFGFATGLFGILMSILPFGIGEIATTVFGALFVLPYYLLYLELAPKGSGSLEAYKN